MIRTEVHQDTANDDPVQQLTVISHVLHYRHEGKLYAYGPYSREIDIWADVFPEVMIASPCRDEEPPADCLPFTRPNIKIDPQPETGGDSIGAKVWQLACLPHLAMSLCRVMRRTDAVHVRCPGNLGLLSTILAPMFSRYRVAKYAGQWNGYSGERVAVRLQRALLKSRWWGSPVTVYGSWPDQPPYVHSFFTSMMTKDQVERAIEVAQSKSLSSPLRILFAGRLAPEKRVDVLLQAIESVIRDGIEVELTIVGDGIKRPDLEEKVNQLGIPSHVKFVGALPFSDSMQWYDWADCLVLPSVHSEGWPKVIAEAMCHGVLCIAVSHGQIPSMLEGRGVLLENGTAEEIRDAIVSIASDHARYEPLMKQASEWACNYSLESLREALVDLLSEQWQVPIHPEIRGKTT